MSSAATPVRRRLNAGAIRRRPYLFALVCAVVLLVANVALQPDFGFTSQWANFAPIALVALASTPSILSGRGGIDLSVGPLMTLVGVVLLRYALPNGWSSPVVIVVLAVGLGAAVGALNGVMVAVLRFQPFIATLCTYFIAGGLVLKWAATPIQLPAGSWIPDLTGSLGPIPAGLLVLGVPLALWAALGGTPFRRTLMAVGSDDVAAYSSGVDVTRTRLLAYTAGGALAGLGGLALIALTSSASASSATSYTLGALAAVALGGTSFLGGRGGLAGSALGAACIYLIQVLLQTLNVSSTWIQLSYGGLFLLAVVLNGDLAPSATARRSA